MNLKNLNDDEVLSSTLTAANAERSATTNLLYHLCEVDSRRLYARAGYPSLFAYCVGALKMSERQAARRVNAARALKDTPQLAEKLNSGTLSLTAVSQAQGFFKQETKAGNSFDHKAKEELFKELEHKSSRETEKILQSQSTSPVRPIKDQIRPITETLSEFRFAADTELAKNLEKLRDLWGMQNMGELIGKMAGVCLKHHDPERKAERAQKKVVLAKSQNPTPAPESRNRYIPAAIRHAVWRRDKGCCTYINAANGQRCESKRRLQLDHIVPFAQGGGHILENLRLRCFAHNQLHAMDCFGPEVLRFGSQ